LRVSKCRYDRLNLEENEQLLPKNQKDFLESLSVGQKTAILQFFCSKIIGTKIRLRKYSLESNATFMSLDKPSSKWLPF